MEYTFYLSHSRTESGPYIQQFLEDLSAAVAALRGTDPAGVGFVDPPGSAGQPLRPAALEALHGSRSLVCLLSPAFLWDKLAVREVEIFRSRLKAFARATGEASAPLVFPVYWIDPGSEWGMPPLPASIRWLADVRVDSPEASHAGFGLRPDWSLPEYPYWHRGRVSAPERHWLESPEGDHADHGLYPTLRSPALRARYCDFVRRFAQRVVEGVEEYPLPPGRVAVAAPQPNGAGHSRAQAAGGPEAAPAARPAGERLRVFLCHASGDKPRVQELYERLKADGMEPWLDAEDLLPGQLWQEEIPRVVRSSHVVVVCLSEEAITKKGYVQKEIGYALDVAQEQPAGTIFLIPLRLEPCEIPDRLRQYQAGMLYEPNGYRKLMSALRARAEKLGLGM